MLRPTADVVLIRRAAGVEQIGSIVLAESAIEELQEGEVVACGPGKLIERRIAAGSMSERRYWSPRPMSVRVGDTVLFSKNGHQMTKVDGEEFVVLREDSIMAVRADALQPDPRWHTTQTIAGKPIGDDVALDRKSDETIMSEYVQY